MAVDAAATPASLKLVCFVLHDQEYGAPIAAVKETLALRPITRVFLTPPWLAGIVNLRGDVVAVIDLAQLLGMAPTVTGDTSRIVVVRAGGRRAGILVDALAELRVVPADKLEPPPATLPPEPSALLAGVVTVEDGKAVRVLEVDRMLNSDAVRALQRSGER